MRCNIFKPLSNNTGEFLMFSQYTDDITKELTGEASYRVVPSKFAVLNLNLNRFAAYSGMTISDANAKISQYIQSYYENMVCTVKEALGTNENNEMYWDIDFNQDGYATQLLWKALETMTLIESSTQAGIQTFPELKFMGDIPIHSNRQVDGMSYNDIYCYIAPNDDEQYYPITGISPFIGSDGEGGTRQMTSFEMPSDISSTIWGWTQASYPPNNGGMTPDPIFDNGSSYSISGAHIVEFPSESAVPRDRHSISDQNIQFQFNCIIVFYDIYNDIDSEEQRILHKNRPAGIYFTGPIEHNDTQDPEWFCQNTITKYVSHEDIFSQGSGWGLRIMSRVVPTPNSSSYTMYIDSGDDYATIAGAMGQIADAIADIRTDMKLQSENYQLFKDHLAIFKNYRTNVPYVREVVLPGDTDPTAYWFVNGHNTGQRVYPE